MIDFAKPRRFERLRMRVLSAFSTSQIVLALVVLLSSCAGDGSELDSTGVPLGPPEIEVDRPAIELSLVEGTSDSVAFTVTNVGGFPLDVRSMSSTEAFLRPLLDGQVSLGKDASHEFIAGVDAYEVEGAPYHGEILIHTNAQSQPVLPVAISLQVTPAPAPEISVLPDTLIASVVEGVIDTVIVEVFNSGTANLVVTDISSDIEELEPIETAQVIQPGESFDVLLRVDATALVPGALDGRLEIHSNDEDEPVSAVELRLTVEFSGPFPPTMSAIQKNVLNGSCLAAGCHGEPWAPLGLYLAPGHAWSHLYEVRAAFVTPEMYLVKPFDSKNSYLITKLVELDDRRVGERMPLGDIPYIDEEAIDVIRRWIDEGALDN